MAKTPKSEPKLEEEKEMSELVLSPHTPSLEISEGSEFMLNTPSQR